MTLGLEAEPPFLAHTLWFGLPQDDLLDWDAVRAACDSLSGTVAFAAWRLDIPGGPRVVAQRQPDLELAIGSVCKLYVLGALDAAVAAGDVAWDTTVPLRARWRSLPSGVLQSWPAESPVTLHTLALQMISISDNTATDHLIHLLGRERIEAALAAMGHAAPARNRPFLTTAELFRLKAKDRQEDRLRRWREGDEAARRELLRRLGDAELSAWDVVLTRPVAVADVEWFASAADLARALDDLRGRRGGDLTRPPLALLGVNPGLPGLRADWMYVGFKGGSEPGVLALAWLLRDEDGRWFALTFLWNDQAAAVDENSLYAIVPAAARLLRGS